jgi:hypothetical protein
LVAAVVVAVTAGALAVEVVTAGWVTTGVVEVEVLLLQPVIMKIEINRITRGINAFFILASLSLFI